MDLIHYCDGCGIRISNADLTAGLCLKSEDKVFCVKCRPQPAPEKHAGPPSSGSKRLIVPPHSPAHSVNRSSQPSMAPAHTEPNSLVPAIAVGIALLVGLLFFVAGGSKTTTTAQSDRGNSRSETPVVAPRPLDRPPDRITHVETPAPAPVPAIRDNAPKPSAPIPPPLVDKADPYEQSAQTAFDALVLDANNPESEIATLEAFIEKFDRSIVASRAHVLLNDVKAKSKPSAPAVAANPPPENAGKTPEVIKVAQPETQPAAPAGAPKSEPAPPSAEAQAAYGAFLDHYWELLRANDASAAQKSLEQAQESPALKAFSTEFVQDRSALALLSEILQLTEKGLLKLKEIERFELRRQNDNVVWVGAHADFQVTDIKDNVLNLDSKGLGMSVTFDSLSFDTRLRLSELEWTSNPREAVYRLFASLLRVRTAMVDLAKARQIVSKSSSSSGTTEEAACFSHVLNRLEATQNEVQAAIAWTQLTKLADAKDRSRLAAALSAFKKTFGATEVAAKNKTQMRPLEIKSAPILIPEGLVAYFPFDDATGNVATEATGQLHACPIKNATWAPGKFGGALDCNGANSEVPISNISMKSGVYSLCAWVSHRENATHYERYVTLAGDAGLIRRSNNGRIEYFMTINKKLESITAPDVADLNRWYHVVGTWDGKTQRLYIDGVLITSVARTGTVEKATDAMVSCQSEYMAGLIDEVRIYDRALSDAEIKTLADPKNYKKE